MASTDTARKIALANRRTLVMVAACGILTLLARPVEASTITWSAPTNISGDSDVSTQGTLLGAFNIGGAGVGNATVNGVLFNALALSGPNVAVGNFNFALATGWASNNSVGNGFQAYTTTASAGNSVNLLSNTSGGAVGGLGQYAIGTFIADATTQSITFTGTLQDTLNGMQFRQVGAAVPEPITLSLVGLGLGVGVIRRRMRR